MRRVLRSHGRTYMLRWSRERAVENHLGHLRTEPAALAFLGRTDGERGNLVHLREMLAGHGALHDLSRASDAEVITMASVLMAGGTLRAVPWNPSPRVIRHAPRSRPVVVAPPPPVEKKREVPKLTWIEIELVGEDDKPVPGEAYEVQFPNRQYARGTLDENGKAHLLTEPGTCKVSFPELDREAWEPA